MKRLWATALFAAAVLTGAAVWLGALNQDEGWYLYAANLVAGGELPYRDFFYTQAPVMPVVYSAFAGIWREWGILGARVFTVAIGLLGVVFAAALAGRLAPKGKGALAALVAFLLLGVNLYHLYYVAIPKTYALASLFVIVGFWLLAQASEARRHAPLFWFAAGAALGFAAGTRISLGAMPAVTGLVLLCGFRRRRWAFLWFGLGGALALAAAYGPFLGDGVARAGLIAAQRYHTARGGFDPVFTVGSLSRLVRWYAPLFVLGGIGVAGAAARRREASAAEARMPSVLLPMGLSALAVFAVQMLAPFPYEDYQVPLMGVAAVIAAVLFVRATEAKFWPLLALGMALATAFGSPLLETWMTNGQDRFWTRKKPVCELAQLREVARQIEELDPNGKTILTQDLYLAIELDRKVPRGLEMGPFSMLDDRQWRQLLADAECPIAALSGYSFAIEPPRCDERPVDTQLEYWGILKRNYELQLRVEDFGQNATPLLVLRRKPR